MDPNDNRTIVQLINTCFICRRMYVTARDLNQHLQQDHHLPVVRYNRPEPLHIEMIPAEHYIYLNMLAPNFDNASYYAVFVTIRHACSLCHSHYPTLERLFRHMEAHFRGETHEEQGREIHELERNFEFFDDHPLNYRLNEATPHQQEDAADAFENENGSFQSDDNTINEESFHADGEDSDHVEEGKDSDQQDSEHATSGVDSQGSVGNDRSEDSAINDQQELNSQHTDGEEEEVFINNDHRNINLDTFINADNVDLNDQPTIGNVTPQERVDEDSENGNTVFEFIYWENP